MSESNQVPVVEPASTDNKVELVVDATPVKTEKLLTQAQVDDIVKDRLQRERDKLKAEQEKAEKQAAETRLAEQNEYKPLAEQRKLEVEKLAAEVASTTAQVEEYKAKAERYEGVLKKFADAQREGLPASVLALLDKLSVDDQLDWIAQNKGELTVAAKVAVPATPRGNNAGKTAEEIAQRTQVAAGAYRQRF